MDVTTGITLSFILLQKQAYSNILKVLPKSESFQNKMLIFFIFLLKT